MGNDTLAKIADLLNTWADKTERSIYRFDTNDYLYLIGKIRYDFNVNFVTATKYLRITLREVFAVTY